MERLKIKMKHSMEWVWNRIPKSTYVGADQFNLGVYDAVANFNIGRKASLKVLEKLGCKDGKYTVNGCRNSNEKRLKNADIKQRKEVVNRRRQLRGQHRKKEDSIERKRTKTK